MAATSLHVGLLFVRQSTPGASWIASRTLRTSWFLINSPPPINIPTNEFNLLTTHWTVATIFLSKPSIIQHRILTCASVLLSTTYKRAKPDILDSVGGNIPTRWNIVPWTRNVYLFFFFLLWSLKSHFQLQIHKALSLNHTKNIVLQLIVINNPLLSILSVIFQNYMNL